ncbi:ferredoxin [Clostridium oceanicum]|uniref:Ferredoxin n=1 Tax=Clostridium oceanicum TaxID=1543 RepID=A0ABN1JWV2_9CLOT
MKAVVDNDTCVGCGLCPNICSEVFEMGNDGKAHVIGNEVPEDVKDTAKEAESSCPVAAIIIE